MSKVPLCMAQKARVALLVLPEAARPRVQLAWQSIRSDFAYVWAVRIEGDDGELRPWPYIHVYSIESRLIMETQIMRLRGRGVQVSGFRIQGSSFRVQVPGFKFQGSSFRVQVSGFKFQGSGFRVWTRLQSPPFGGFRGGLNRLWLYTT